VAEEEVGSLERVCARFAPNFGPGAGHQGWGSAAQALPSWFVLLSIELPNARHAWSASRRGCNGEGLRPDCAKHQQEGSDALRMRTRRPGVELRDSLDSAVIGSIWALRPLFHEDEPEQQPGSGPAAGGERR
jgi:hypothetical protein